MKTTLLISAGLISACTMMVTPLVMADANGGAKSRDLIIQEIIKKYPKQSIRIRKVANDQQKIEEVKPSQPSRTLRVRVSTNKSRYRIGDSVVISVTPTQDAYITIIDNGTSGKIHQIFPNKYNTQRFVRAHQTIRIPGYNDGYEYIANGPVGPELIKVIASTNNKPVVQDRSMSRGGVFRKINKNSGALSRDLNIVLKDKQHIANTFTAEHTIYIE